jgi:isopropylmalate/homocitrate/citramalate synthase
MAGAEEVMAAVRRRSGTRLSGLVLNEKGYDRALAAGVDEVHYAFACTDDFGLRNQNQTTAQGLEIAHTLIRRARSDQKPITVTLIVAFGCPFSGRVPSERVLGIVDELLREPPDQLSLADTIGVAVPTQVRELVAAVAASSVATGAHLHNTRNTGYANAVAALEAGAKVLDASVGGIGGCPFAPRATGNIAAEDLVYLLEGMGVRTGVDLDRLIATADWLAGELGKELPGMLYKAGGFPAAST